MSKLNFDNLYFSIDKFGGKKKIQDSYPELLPYTEIKDISTEEWKVAILVTDLGSPFVKIKDGKQKIEEIFKALDLDKDKKHSDIFRSFLDQKQGGIIHACTFLLEYFNNHEFAAWYELNKLYYQFVNVLRKPVEDPNDDKELDKKLSLQTKLNSMQDTLKKYETNLFGSAAMKADAAYKSTKARKMNWNEKYADENQVE